MKRRNLLALLPALCMVLCLAACGNTAQAPETPVQQPQTAQPVSRPQPQNADTAPAPAAGPKILRLAESSACPSLDVHKGCCGQYTSIYGVSETLFRIGDDLSIQPLLAKSYTVSEDGRTWTVELADAAFSNGTPLTASMVIRNIARLAEVNERFTYLRDFIYAADGDKVLNIITMGVYPTMLRDLSAPELGIMDLDGTTDFVNAPVCTGPFVVKSFEPEGAVEVVKNTAYWNGEVKLDGAVFRCIPDDEARLGAMQAGEIDGYVGVTAAARDIYAADPAAYVLTEVPATRLQFYALNKKTLDDKVRAAINLAVDSEAIAASLGGAVSPAVGPFRADAPYGQVTKSAPDAAGARALLEEDGYTIGASGFYEKKGKPLTVNICCCAADALDSVALLIQEQLRAVGVDAVLTVQEDPDSTYVAGGDYDIALYCMIADKAGDPYYCIDALFRRGGRWAKAGFPTRASEKLIDRLKLETDAAKRAELANQIVQMTIDDNAFGYVGLFNKTTVVRSGVTGVAEASPFDFYGVSAATDVN